MGWRTIVVGIDGSDASRCALKRAAELAIAADARLVVASAAPVIDETTLQLGEYVDHVGVEAETDLELGEAAASVVAAAEKYEADLIVVGTGEPDLFGRHVPRSVSQSVARRAHCDVLITRS